MVHSNRCTHEDKALAKTVGAELFVSKPLQMDDLVKFLSSDQSAASVTHKELKAPERGAKRSPVLCRQ